ncbi:amidohydrolase [Chloroflexi bacterium TSY]|nr:amidohydrolase [Chloroflexi bacterium TSY]
MIAELDVLEQTTSKTQVHVSVIDCDIHNFDAYGQPEFNDIIVRYLEKKWQRHHEMIGRRGHASGSYPRGYRNAARHDAWPPSGMPPGLDMKFVTQQLLNEWDMDYGILNPLAGPGGQLNVEYGAAYARAINDYQIAEWLEPEPRYRASMVVCEEDAELAAQEIHRLGDHDGFVQVLLLARTKEPLGRRKYWKIYEAAVEYNLPIGIHFGGSAGHPITAGGWPSYYIEDHGGMSQSFQAQVASLVCEGIFEHFPTLRIAIIEGGFAWLPSLAWRLDQSWSRLREEVPYLKRAPSEYIAEHFWFTTQPMEEPRQPHHFRQLLRQMNGSERLMFATDYPHWDFDSPARAVPLDLPREVRQKIMAENARDFYGLD